MGFSTLLDMTGSALPKVFEAGASFEEAKSLKQAAAEQERLAAQQAAAIDKVASQNQMRASRNATAQLGRARVDAAASNTVQDGSTYRRGVDLATRLQDEIYANAQEELDRANSIRRQGAYDAWDLRNQAKQSRAEGFGAVASAVGSVLVSAGKELAKSSGTGTKAKAKTGSSKAK